MTTRVYCKECGSYSPNKTIKCESCGNLIKTRKRFTKADWWAMLVGFPLAFLIMGILTPLTRYGLGGLETAAIMFVSYFGVRSVANKIISK